MRAFGIIIALTILVAASQAALFPRLMTQVPAALHGRYLLLLKVNPDKAKQGFTNTPPFAQISSNNMTLASGARKLVEGVMHISQKGTNVYAISFADNSTWLMTTTSNSSQFVILEPIKEGSKEATMFVVRKNGSSPQKKR